MAHTFARMMLISSVCCVAALALGMAGASAASAHAIVELNGDPAYAGRTSILTLELQHGCLGNEAGIDTVVAYFDPSFVSVKPKSVPGWKSQKATESDGTHRIKWTLTGDRPKFNTPTYFPMTISWPKQSGVYGVPVKQKCLGEVNVWDTPDGPATANRPSPPLYPLPQIRVLPRP